MMMMMMRWNERTTKNW